MAHFFLLVLFSELSGIEEAVDFIKNLKLLPAQVRNTLSFIIVGLIEKVVSRASFDFSYLFAGIRQSADKHALQGRDTAQPFGDKVRGSVRRSTDQDLSITVLVDPVRSDRRDNCGLASAGRTLDDRKSLR